MDDQVAFGRNVRAARESANISREVAAERGGITVEYLGEVERGEKWPTLKVIRSLARGIGVSSANFFEFEEQGAGSPLQKLHQVLEKRAPEQQQQAFRVVKALFGI